MGTDVVPLDEISVDKLTPDQIAEARERWPDHSEAQQRKYMCDSLRAKARHAMIADPVTGRRVFGGPQPNTGNKSKKRRAAEAIADLAQGDRQKEVIDALFSGLSKSNSAAVRVSTARKIVDIEREERELQLKEDEFDGQSKDELKGILARGLRQMIQRGDLSMQELLNAAAEAQAQEDSIVDVDVID